MIENKNNLFFLLIHLCFYLQKDISLNLFIFKKTSNKKNFCVRLKHEIIEMN